MIELLFSIVLSAIRGEITVFGIRTPFSFIAVHPSVAESFPGIPAPFSVPLCYFYNNSLSAQHCQVARLNSLVTPCKKEWHHSGMMSPPVIKTQKMYKTKKIVVIPRIALPYFHYDFWHLLGKLSKTWVMQQNARSKQIQQTSSLWRGTVHTHTRTLAASIYKHISLPFWNVIQWATMCPGDLFPWAGDTIPGAGCLSMSLGHHLCPISLCSLLGVYMLYTNAFIYKAFSSWKKPFAVEREIPFSW